jgi:hypothetical protein
VVALANDSFRAFHDGHQWRAMVYENNAVSTEFVLQSGFKPVRFADEDTLEGLSPLMGPALFMLTREQARRTLPGTPARNAFEWQPPRFRFNASQRRLLWNALFDESDEALGALASWPPSSAPAAAARARGSGSASACAGRRTPPPGRRR